MAKAIVLFLAAGLAEIGGGCLVWLWLREFRSLRVGVLGGMIPVLYGIVPHRAKLPQLWSRVHRLRRSVLFIGDDPGITCG